MLHKYTLAINTFCTKTDWFWYKIYHPIFSAGNPQSIVENYPHFRHGNDKQLTKHIQNYGDFNNFFRFFFCEERKQVAQDSD